MEFRWSLFNKGFYQRVRYRTRYLLIPALIAGLVLPLWIVAWGLGKMQHYHTLGKEIARVEKTLQMRDQEAKKQRALCQLKTEVDAQFLDHIVAPCIFLQPQESKLQEVKETLDFQSQMFIFDNLDTLSENQLVFKENPNKANQIHLEHPVYMNLSDLEQIIALVEGVKVGLFAPHPLRCDLSFDRITLKRVYNSPGIISVDFTVRKG